MGNEVLLHRENHVAVLTLNRPEAYNSLNSAMRSLFLQHVTSLRNDPDIRVVVITGAGDRAFCTGADLKERNNLTEQDYLVQRTMSPPRSLLYYPKPLVAAINGFAIAGGLELTLFCDLRIASENARFQLAEVRRGIFPGGGSPSLLPRLIGETKAKEMIFTGRMYTAAECLSMGLLNHVVPAGNALSAAMELAVEIAANAPVGVQQVKKVMEHTRGMDLESALHLENEAWTRCLYTADRLEGTRAFVEKRQPVFRGQ